MTEVLGRIIVIKRNGSDGAHFPLRSRECLFGRNNECDIRIQLPNVSKEHAKITVDPERKVWLENLSGCQHTLLNGSPLPAPTEVAHLDVFTISDRSFRFEFPTPKKLTPKKSPKSEKRRSSKGTPQEMMQERKSFTPSSSPRAPQPHDTLKENLHLLHSQSVPLKEEDESLASPMAPRSPLATTMEINSINVDSKTTSPGKRKTPRRSSTSKAKRVSFGPLLSPEHFDTTLPPATPVKRGATPRRLSAESKTILSDHKKRRSVAVSPSTDAISEEEEILEEEIQEDIVPDSLSTGDFTEETESTKMDSQNEGEIEVEKSAAEPANTPPLLHLDEESPKAGPSVTPRRSSRRLSSLMLSQIEAILDSQDVEVKPAEQEGNIKRRLATPVRKAIEKGFQLKATKKKLATPVRKEIEAKPSLKETKKKLTTPVRKEIEAKPSLKETKKKLATPVRKEIEAKPSLKETKKKLATPLRKEIQSKPSLRESKKRMFTPLRKEIEAGTNLRETKKRLGTPLRKAIQSKPTLRQTKKTLSTPLRKEIKKGVQLKTTKKALATPVRKEIESKPTLRKTKKMLATPIRQEIQSKPKLRATKKIMALDLQIDIIKGVTLRETKKRMTTPLKEEITRGITLRKTLKSLPTPLKAEITQGMDLRKTKKKLPEPLREEIKQGKALKQTKKRMSTPLKQEIQKGTSLRQTREKLATPLKEEINKGIQLKETMKKMATPLRKEIQAKPKLNSAKRRHSSSAAENPTKKLKKTPRKSLAKAREIKKALKTPLREEIQSGFKLRRVMRLATPLRHDIHRRPSLRAVRRKSTKLVAEDNPPKRKPTYAEILKRPKKVAVRRLSSKREPVMKFGPTAKPGSKALASSTLQMKPTVTGTKSQPAAEKTPLVCETEIRTLEGVSEMFLTPVANHTTRVTRSARKSGNWLDIIAKSLPGAKPKDLAEQDFEGLKELFATPEEAAKKIRAVRKRSGNWLDAIAKTLNEAKPKRSSLGKLEGLKEMFSTPTASSDDSFSLCLMTSPKDQMSTPSLRTQDAQISVHTEPAAITKTPSLRQAATLRNANKVAVTPKMVEAIKPTRTPSLRSAIVVSSPVQPAITPSLRGKDAQFLLVESMQASKTPSLRKPEQAAEIVQAIEPTNTPSLRSMKDATNTVQVDYADSAPTVRNTADKQRKSLGFTGIKRLMKSPKTKHSVANPEDNYEFSWFASPHCLAKSSKTSSAVAQVSGDFVVEIVNNRDSGEKCPRTRRAVADVEDNFVAGLFASPVQIYHPVKSEPHASPKAIEEVVAEVEQEVTVTNEKPTRRTTRAKRAAAEPIQEPAKKRTRQEKTENDSLVPNLQPSKRPTRTSAAKKTPAKNNKNATADVETPKQLSFPRTKLESIPELPTPLTTPRVTRRRKESVMSPMLEVIEEQVSVEESKKRSTRGKAKEVSVEATGDLKSSVEAEPATRSTRSTRNRKPANGDLSHEVEVPSKPEKTTRSARSTRSSKKEEEPSENQVTQDAAPEESVKTTRSTRNSKAAKKAKEEQVPAEESAEEPVKAARSTRSTRAVIEPMAGPEVQVVVPSKRTTRGRVAKTKEATFKPEPEITAAIPQQESNDIVVEQQQATKTTRATRGRKKVVEVSEQIPTPATRGKRVAVEEPKPTRSTRAKKTKVAEKQEVGVGVEEQQETRKTRSTRARKEAVEVLDKLTVPDEQPRTTRSTRGKEAIEEKHEVVVTKGRTNRATTTVVVDATVPGPDKEPRPQRATRGQKNTEKQEIPQRKGRTPRTTKPVTDEEPQAKPATRKRKAVPDASPAPKRNTRSSRK